jgi:hypothetical protein
MSYSPLKLNRRFGEHVASIFRIEEKAEQETRVQTGDKKLCSGGDMFLRNVCLFTTDYTALYPIRQYCSDIKPNDGVGTILHSTRHASLNDVSLLF